MQKTTPIPALILKKRASDRTAQPGDEMTGYGPLRSSICCTMVLNGTVGNGDVFGPYSKILVQVKIESNGKVIMFSENEENGAKSRKAHRNGGARKPSTNPSNSICNLGTEFSIFRRR